jgi:hypothetical protein
LVGSGLDRERFSPHRSMHLYPNPRQTIGIVLENLF